MAWKTKIPYRLIDFSARVHPSDNYVIGVKRISDSGGAGTWVRIDENDNVVEVQSNYFQNHPTYMGIEDNQTFENETKNIFVRIPKFYIKSDGNTRFWISPEPRESFKCHPAFMSNGSEIDEIYIGKYEGFLYEGKMYSTIDKESFGLEIMKPTVRITFDACKRACESWNTSEEMGAVQVNGYHMMNIHELSALQWLALIEIASTNTALYYGEGRLFGTSLYSFDEDINDLIDGVNGEVVSKANFHNIIGLWGNVWEFVEGIKTNLNNKLMIWDNDGRKVFKTTDIEIPSKNQNSLWSPGVTEGYYKNRLLTATYNCDTADLFVPDFTTLTPYYENGCYSDGVFGRIKCNFDCVVCYGGGFDTGNYGGLYSYRFDMKQPLTSTSSSGAISDEGDTADDVGCRLCFHTTNI